MIPEPRPIPDHHAVDSGLRAKEPNRIAGMFDAIARRYDLLNRVLSGGMDQRWRARAVRELRLQGRETLLDLCTGTADVALAAVRPGAGAARVVGVDFSPEMLRIGMQKCRQRGVWPRVGLVCADATCIPLSDSSVDAATVAFGIRNVQDTAAACRELARVVRTGGRLAVLEFGLPRQRTLRAIYLWYSHRLLPAVGRLVSQHASAYEYLPESVARFPPPEEFGRMLQQSGFPHVRVVPLTFGIVYLYVAER